MPQSPLFHLLHSSHHPLNIAHLCLLGKESRTRAEKMDQDDFWADESSIRVAPQGQALAVNQSRSDTTADRISSNNSNSSSNSGRAQALQQMRPKRFQCTQPGCDKRFTRMEHMQRHALNHTAGESTCPRCNAHFKRPDLLGTIVHLLIVLHS